VPLFNATPTFRITEFVLKKLETFLYHMVLSIFPYLAMTHKCEIQIDRCTDFLIANAMLHYVAQLEIDVIEVQCMCLFEHSVRVFSAL